MLIICASSEYLDCLVSLATKSGVSPNNIICFTDVNELKSFILEKDHPSPSCLIYDISFSRNFGDIILSVNERFAGARILLVMDDSLDSKSLLKLIPITAHNFEIISRSWEVIDWRTLFVKFIDQWFFKVGRNKRVAPVQTLPKLSFWQKIREYLCNPA